MEMHDASAKIQFVREYGMGSTAGIVKPRQFYQSYCVFIISFLIFTPDKMLDPVVFFHTKGKETLGMRLLAQSIHGTRENR